jgi:UDP-N-acetylglucosamine--dolichyl-phosphate N-acetylglucosaminephosphotransferase
MTSQLTAVQFAVFDGTVGFIASFVIVWVLMPRLIHFFKQRGRVGVDVHKVDRPEIAELGGVGIITGIVGGLIASAMLVSLGFFSDI